MSEIKRKIWKLIRGGRFRGYLRTASGYPLSLSGCMAERPAALTVSGCTVQDGTPSPDNPVEIQGVGSRTKNLLNLSGYTWESGSIGSGDGKDTDSERIRTVGYIPFSPGSYVISRVVVDGIDKAWQTIAARFYDADKKYIGTNGLSHGFISFPSSGGIAFQAAANTAFIRFIAYDVDLYKLKIQIEEGDTDTYYEPFGYKLSVKIKGLTEEKSTAPIYMDIPLYGAESFDILELDTEKHQATLTRSFSKKVFDGTENWVKDTGTKGRYNLGVADAALGSTSDACAMSSHYKSTYGNLDKNIFCGGYNRQIAIIDTRYSTVESFTAWLSEQKETGTPVTAIYKMKEPVAVDISDKVDWGEIPKLWRGTVTITADATVEPSTMTIKYYTDTPETAVVTETEV